MKGKKRKKEKKKKATNKEKLHILILIDGIMT